MLRSINLRLTPRPFAEHGGKAALPIDLSASLNPIGPSPAATEAALGSRLTRYPEVGGASLAQAAADRHGLPAEAVVPVPGASFGLWLALVAVAKPGDTCLALGPCFREYERYSGISGAEYVEVTCPAEDRVWTESAVDAALRTRPAICVLGNPANPAGTALSATALRAVCSAHPGTLFVIDEAFAAFASERVSVADGEPQPANTVVVRSLTKELGMPGLRMGYLVARPELATALAELLPAWPLSAPAVAAAVAGIGDVEHVRAGRRAGHEHVARLTTSLRRAGAEVFPSSVNYVLCRAPGLAARLADRGIAIRDCTSFGLPDHYRLAAPSPAELDTVLRAIDG